MNKTMAVRRRGERPFAPTWREMPFNEIVDIIGGGTPRTTIKEFWDGDIPWLSVSDFNGDARKVHTTEKTITLLGLEKSAAKLLKEGTVVISARGTVGKIAILGRDMTFNQTCYGLQAKPITTNEFVYYLLKYHIPRLQQLSYGSVFSTITRETFNQLNVSLPPLPVQKRIAHILSALDDKIECNRRINKTLEAMAQAIFKSWFVDFDPVRAKTVGANGRSPLPKEIDALFPDTFADSELGRIPEGWEVRSLYESASYINGAAFKNHDFSPDNSGLPVIKISELKNGIIPQTKFCNKDLNPKYKITCGDILFSWSGQPETSIDIFLWSGTDAWLNQHTFKVVPHDEEQKCFVFFLLKHLKPTFIEIARNKQTTGLGHVTTRDMQRMKVVFPSRFTLDRFNKIVQPIFNQIFGNKKEEQTLARTRDYLLPKLLSGQVTVRANGRSPQHHRRSIRLKGYDYTLQGAYFITMCTWNRECMFGEIVNGGMQMNQCGQIVNEEWQHSSEIRREIEMDRFVVMPNHIHGIVFINNDEPVGANGRSPLHMQPKSLSSFIAGFKSAVTKRINELRHSPGMPVWQRNYYEHVVRNENELNRIREYIANNPLQWDKDKENPDIKIESEDMPWQ